MICADQMEGQGEPELYTILKTYIRNKGNGIIRIVTSDGKEYSKCGMEVPGSSNKYKIYLVFKTLDVKDSDHSRQTNGVVRGERNRGESGRIQRKRG